MKLKHTTGLSQLYTSHLLHPSSTFDSPRVVANATVNFCAQRQRSIMNNKFQVEVDPNEDTEWNDILRSHGIIPEKPPSPTAQLEEALEEALQKQHDNRLEDLDLDELAALEDDEDEDFLESYKQKRMAEMRKMADKPTFGHVIPVTKQEYNDEVTKASESGDEGTWVLLHMSLTSALQSRLLSQLLIQIASRFPEIKVCDIPATRAVENYPEQNCPTLIIYHKGNIARQYVTLTQLGGNATSEGDLERVLVDIGAIQPGDRRLTMNQDDEEFAESGRKLKFASRQRNDSDDDDFYD